jgi:hypothetical protein
MPAMTLHTAPADRETSMISQELRDTIVERAETARTRREVVDAIYGSLRDANLNPQTIPLSDLKSVLVDALRVAPPSALPDPVSVAL